MSATFVFVSVTPVLAASACPADQQEVTIGVDDGNGGITHCIPKNSTGLNDNPIVVFLKAVLQFFAVGVGLLVTGGIITGGVIYMTARGNASQVETAQEVIRNSFIGLLLFLGLFAIVNFLIPGGILT